MFEDIKAVCEPHGLSPVTIPTQYYGRMDGEAIRKLILDKSQ
jgi:cellobiose-specific phosphotransferase system component IIB